MPEVKSKNNSKSKTTVVAPKAKAPKAEAQKAPAKNSVSVGAGSSRSPNTESNVGLTVRIEVNLPADGEQETYDRIFKSIRENLLNG